MSILDEIADCVISGRLQEIFLSDPEYQEQLFREFGLFPHCD